MGKTRKHHNEESRLSGLIDLIVCLSLKIMEVLIKSEGKRKEKALRVIFLKFYQISKHIN
jgi:hypothetical protein